MAGNVNPLADAIPTMGSAFTAQRKAEKAAEDATGAAAQASYAAEDKAHSTFELESEESGKKFAELQKRGEELGKDSYKPPTPEDPLKSYGASVAALMGIASIFTKGSMIPVLNAGAAAVNAARQGNTDEYNRKFEEWKTNHDLMKEQLDWEAKAWEVWRQKLKDDHAEASGYAAALAARTGNTAMAALNRKGDTETMSKMLDTQANLQSHADSHAEHLITLKFAQEHAKNYFGWLKDHPDASPDEKADQLNIAEGGAHAAKTGATIAAEASKTVMDTMIAEYRKNHGGQMPDGKTLNQIRQAAFGKTEEILTGNSAPAPAAGKAVVDLHSVAGLNKELNTVVGGITDFFTGKRYGQTDVADVTKKNLENLRQETLAGFRTAQAGTGISRAAEMKAVDDIVPKALGLAGYQGLRNSVSTTRGNIASTLENLYASAQSAGNAAQRGKINAAITTMKSLLAKYDDILAQNPEQGEKKASTPRPADVPENLWNALTPEEQALWRK